MVIGVINTPLLIAERKSDIVKLVVIVGVGLSFLLFLLLKTYAGQRERALKLAEAMTDIQQKNRELKHSEERFQLALESSAMGVWSLQLSDNHVQWDASMRALFGLEDKSTLTGL